MTSSHPRDPTSLREALERSKPGTGYDVESGLARHRELIGSGAALPEWARRLPRARRFGRLWLVSSLVMLGGVAAVLWRAQPPAPQAARPAPMAAPAFAPPAATSAPTVVPLPLSSEPLPPASDAPAVAPPGAERAGAASPNLSPARPVTPVARAPLKGGTRAAAAEPGPAVAASIEAKSSPLAHDHLMAELAASPSSPSAASAEVAAQEPGAPRAPAPDAIDPEVIEEMQQLATAERLLATMPSRTLSMVREGMQRFPRGYLAQERRYLEIMALFGLNMPKDAELLSRSFLRDFPNGPYRRKIQRALERGGAE